MNIVCRVFNLSEDMHGNIFRPLIKPLQARCHQSLRIRLRRIIILLNNASDLVRYLLIFSVVRASSLRQLRRNQSFATTSTYYQLIIIQSSLFSLAFPPSTPSIKRDVRPEALCRTGANVRVSARPYSGCDRHT